MHTNNGQICAAVMCYEIHLASFSTFKCLNYFAADWKINKRIELKSKNVEQMLLRCPGSSVIKLYYLVESYTIVNSVGYDEVRWESGLSLMSSFFNWQLEEFQLADLQLNDIKL